MLLFLSVSAISLAAGNIYIAFNDNGNEVIVYPNPVLGSEFSIKADKNISEITILNVLGQPVFTQRYLKQKKVNIELETGYRGVFILQVKMFDGTISTKRVLFK